MAVTGLIMTLLSMSVSLVYQRFRTSSQRSDRQQQVLLLSQRLGVDLRRAPLASVTVHYQGGDPNAGDLALSMLTPLTDDGTYQRDAQGDILYQAYSIYYRSSTGQDVRWLRAPLATPTALPVAQAPADMMAAITINPGRSLVRAPAEFRLLDSAGAPAQVVTDPARLQVVLLGVSGPGRLPFTFVVDQPG